MNDSISKFTATLKYKEGTFTIDYYKDLNNKNIVNRIKWLPLQRIIDVFELDRKETIKFVGRHCLKKIELDGLKVECVDSLAVLRLNELILDPDFYNSVLKFSVWRDNIWFEIHDVLTLVPKLKSYIERKEMFSSKVNFYDRAQSDIYHNIENTDEENNKVLKLCLEKRRIFKIQCGVSTMIESFFGNVKIDNFLIDINHNIKMNKSRRYNERLSHAEQVAWETELSQHDLI